MGGGRAGPEWNALAGVRGAPWILPPARQLHAGQAAGFQGCQDAKCGEDAQFRMKVQGRAWSGSKPGEGV